MLHRTDAIVRVVTTTICGTDLHVLKGDVPAVQDERILGHEGVGTVIELGSTVSNFLVGDCVIISCLESCGHCTNCRTGLDPRCLEEEEGQSDTDWVVGHLITGTQAEYVRVPYEDNSLYKLPATSAMIRVPCSRTSCRPVFEIGSMPGKSPPGDVAAVIGAGPVGLAAIATAGLYGAATIIAKDLDQNRLNQARDFGATNIVVSGSLD